MFGSEALDITVGLILVFLLVSIMLTALTEMLEALFKTRAADLEDAIMRMLVPSGAKARASGGFAEVQDFYEHAFVSGLYSGNYKPARGSRWLGRKIGGSLPSYIPRDLFSGAVLDLVRTTAEDAPIAHVVSKIDAAYGVSQRRAALESWYDGAMDRISGQYKRRTHKLLFLLGLLTAALFNINAFAITQYLREHPQARGDMVVLARTVQTRNAASPSGTGDAEPPRDAPLCAPNSATWAAAARCREAIASVGLPVGWSKLAVAQSFPGYDPEHGPWDQPHPPPFGWLLFDVLVALCGWAIVGLASTLGAPFWFDVLNKVMVIRSTVKPAEKSGDEGSEDRAGGHAAKAPDSAAPAVVGGAVQAAKGQTSDDGAIG